MFVLHANSPRCEIDFLLTPKINWNSWLDRRIAQSKSSILTILCHEVWKDYGQLCQAYFGLIKVSARIKFADAYLHIAYLHAWFDVLSEKHICKFHMNRVPEQLHKFADAVFVNVWPTIEPMKVCLIINAAHLLTMVIMRITPLLVYFGHEEQNLTKLRIMFAHSSTNDGTTNVLSNCWRCPTPIGTSWMSSFIPCCAL